MGSCIDPFEWLKQQRLGPFYEVVSEDWPEVELVEEPAAELIEDEDGNVLFDYADEMGRELGVPTEIAVCLLQGIDVTYE